MLLLPVWIWAERLGIADESAMVLGEHWGDAPAAASLVLALVYCAAATTLFGMTSKLTEHEADVSAWEAECKRTPQVRLFSAVAPAPEPQMVGALRALADFYPEAIERRTLQYPSLLDRIVFLQRVHHDPAVAEKLQLQLFRLKSLLLVGLAVGSFALASCLFR